VQRVLADDFSGAAEVAGVGFRYGLSATVQLDSRTAPGCDLSVLDLDSRSRSPAEAVRLVRSVLDKDHCAFKKIDSVLRGHVFGEIQPFLESGRYSRALVVPFNPDLGRTIKAGVYRINGRPIAQTPFRQDPEFPALTSEVASMLGAGAEAVCVCRVSDTFADSGTIVGEGETHEELRAWAKRIDQRTLPVGAAPFFAAWLESRGRRVVARPSQKAGERVLVLSGTTSRVVDWRRARKKGEVCVLPLPDAAFEGGSHESLRGWASDVVGALDSSGFAVASIGGARLLDRSESPRLAGYLAELATSVLARCRIDQLWLEGGATASAVIRRLGWMSLTVVGELAAGVVQLRPVSGGPLVTVKPGSYPWGGKHRV
jgi:D-threonate/D-erythronate kinase